jgi:hypothetical protein
MLLCLRPGGDSISVREVWDMVKANFLRTVGSYIGLAFVMGLAFLLLMIPGIYLMVPMSLFFVVQLVESTGFGQTISRAVFLTKGKWWSTFGLIMIMTLMLVVLFSVLGGLIGGLAVLGGGGSARAGNLNMFSIILSSLNGLMSLLIYPPLLIALAFQYFNLVGRKEGVGMRHMVDQLGTTPAAVQNNALRPDDEGEY